MQAFLLTTTCWALKNAISTPEKNFVTLPLTLNIDKNTFLRVFYPCGVSGKLILTIWNACYVTEGGKTNKLIGIIPPFDGSISTLYNKFSVEYLLDFTLITSKYRESNHHKVKPQPTLMQAPCCVTSRSGGRNSKTLACCHTSIRRLTCQILHAKH